MSSRDSLPLPSWVNLEVKTKYTLRAQTVEVVGSLDTPITFIVWVQEPGQEFTDFTLEWIYRFIAKEYMRWE